MSTRHPAKRGWLIAAAAIVLLLLVVGWWQASSSGNDVAPEGRTNGTVATVGPQDPRVRPSSTTERNASDSSNDAAELGQASDAATARLFVEFPKDAAGPGAAQWRWIRVLSDTASVVAEWPLRNALSSEGVPFTPPHNATSLVVLVVGGKNIESAVTVAETTAQRADVALPQVWRAKFEEATLRAVCSSPPPPADHLWINCVSATDNASHGRNIDNWRGETIEWNLLPGEYSLSSQYSPEYETGPHAELMQIVGQLRIEPGTVVLQPGQAVAVRLTAQTHPKWAEVVVGERKVRSIVVSPDGGAVRIHDGSDSRAIYDAEEPMAAELDDSGRIKNLGFGSRAWLSVGSRLFFAHDEAVPIKHLPTMAVIEYEDGQFGIVDAGTFNPWTGSTLHPMVFSTASDIVTLNLEISFGENLTAPQSVGFDLSFISRKGGIPMRIWRTMTLRPGDNRIVIPPDFDLWVTGFDSQELDMIAPAKQDDHGWPRIGPALSAGMSMDLRLRVRTN